MFWCFDYLVINPQKTKSASKIPNLRKTIIKYNLEEYFGIDAQMKVIDLEILILSILVKFTNDIANILLFNLKLKILTKYNQCKNCAYCKWFELRVHAYAYYLQYKVVF
jgi:hypothetical protein